MFRYILTSPQLSRSLTLSLLTILSPAESSTRASLVSTMYGKFPW